MTNSRIIAVVGAISRKATGEKAEALRKLGAEVVE